MLTDEEVAKIIPLHEEGVAELNEKRAARIREALEGRTQKQTAELLGVSREGMRKMLDPEARELAAGKERARRRAASAASP